jgi:hypothetical protein
LQESFEKKTSVFFSLTHITFGEKFNQVIDKGILPKNLIQIIFKKINFLINIDEIKSLRNIFILEDNIKNNMRSKITYNNNIYSFYTLQNFLKKSNYENLKTIISSNKFFGKVILEDLVKQVFYPNRMNKSINKYSYFL